MNTAIHQKVVVKIGSSSVTGTDGHISEKAVLKLCEEISSAVRSGHQIILVSSGAIATGLAAFDFEARPSDMVTLQAVAAVGQHMLMQVYSNAFAGRGLTIGQVLLAPLDFAHRIQYLHARRTLARLLPQRRLNLAFSRLENRRVATQVGNKFSAEFFDI